MKKNHEKKNKKILISDLLIKYVLSVNPKIDIVNLRPQVGSKIMEVRLNALNINLPLEQCTTWYQHKNALKGWFLVQSSPKILMQNAKDRKLFWNWNSTISQANFEQCCSRTKMLCPKDCGPNDDDDYNFRFISEITIVYCILSFSNDMVWDLNWIQFHSEVSVTIALAC